MIFWVFAGVLTFGIVLLLLWPVLSAGTDEENGEGAGEEALAVYRDQLQELERDLDVGRLGAEDFEAAKLEVERRMLAAAAEQEKSAAASPQSVRKRRLAASVLVIFAVPAGALLTYVSVGSPGMRDLPLTARTDGAGTRTLAGSTGSQATGQERANGAQQEQPGVSEMITGLQAKLENNPDDADGWALLGRSYMVTERYRDAVDAYAKAIALTPDNLQLIAARGEALVLAADGVVPPAAVEDFRAVNLKQPLEPRARYYLGLARSQAADAAGALKWWIALEADTPPGAPWEALVTQRIDEIGTEAGIDVASLREAERESRPESPAPASVPGPSADDVAAAQDMTAEDRSAMIQSMVDRLADRLQEEPDDLDGWLRLARAYGVLGKTKEAINAQANAARLAPDDLNIQLSYARALFPPGTPETGMTEEFVSLVGHIRELAPNNPDSLFYGGLVAYRKGDAATAKALWSDLLALIGPDAPARGMLEARIKALGG
ncbi:c-type cytochrome biogenesis protein CcmI [Nisaea nitritireducens]|uniref:c-type cytochrome biogenesis protein CcmI n=1 Tax=Nisaea nitritireducens TaxID=568392 RepID=UPI00186951B8|nr:c-type cytochrome biogenesis protein CcmI [Nisaea nitritireducens]